MDRITFKKCFMQICEHIIDDLPDHGREQDLLHKTMMQLRHIESIENDTDVRRCD